MEINSTSPSFSKSRIGFHYFPDALHYREADLQRWVPELTALGASWLVLQAPCDRAIPENFIAGLIRAGIEPILAFNLSLSTSPDLAMLNPLLSSYVRWGVHAAVFFDRPNSRSAWSSAGWAQQDLVERFLDRYIPVTTLAIQSGLSPIFPTLEPGGGYWDTAFLRSALESLEQRNENVILDQMILSAYAWTGGKSMNWGAGGPLRHPEARPYFTPDGSEDQRGFRAFDWYNAISQAVLQKSCPLVVFGAGTSADPANTSPQTDETEQASLSVSQVRLMKGEKVADPLSPSAFLEPVPAHVISCNFWLLSTDMTSPFSSQAWFRPDGSLALAAQQVKGLSSRRSAPSPEAGRAAATPGQPQAPTTAQAAQPSVQTRPGSSIFSNQASEQSAPYPIQHYLLLPTYEWGVADWHLDVIRPFIKRHKPTVGFSLKEAAFAQRVTVVGNQQIFSDQMLENLRGRGCIVERISGDGTKIASLLAER